jgi:hypothetical protein
MSDKIEEAVEEIMVGAGVTRAEALFIILCQIGNEYVEASKGEGDRATTIEIAVEALEENLHEV